MAQTKVKLISDGVIDVNHLASGHSITTDNIGEGSNLYYTDARVSTYLSTNNYATEGYVTTAVANLVDSAPTTLDTLNELAAALGDDPNFATTVTNSIATKLPLAGGNITGNFSVDTNTLYVDAANNRVGIGTSSPTFNFEVENSSGQVILGIIAQDGNYSTLLFGDVSNNYVNQIRTDHSTNALTFHTATTTLGGNERMRIDLSGNVGINTNSPSNTLHIYKNATIGPITTTNTANAGLRIQDSGANMYLDGNSIILDNTGYLTTVGTYDFVIGTNNTVRMHIDRGGNIGVGTNFPDDKFQIDAPNSQLRLRDTDDTTYTQFSSSGNLLAIRQNSTTASHFWMNSDGDVGLGTNTPDQKLEVVGNAHINYSLLGRGIRSANRGELFLNATGAGDVSEIFFGYGDGYTENNIRWGISDRGTASGILSFYVGPAVNPGGVFSTAMALNANGYLGLGTTSPANKLNVNGDIGFTGYLGQGNIYGNTGNASYARVQLYDPSTGYTTFNNISYGYYFQTNSGTKLTILNNGNVGIGNTSPQAPLHVYNAGTANTQDIVAVLGSSGNRPVLQFSESTAGNITAGMSLEYNGNGSGDSNYMVINSVANVPRFTVMSGGNVGIGTTSPDYKLDVSGEIGVDSYIRHNGDTDTFFGFDGQNSYKVRTGGVDRFAVTSDVNVNSSTDLNINGTSRRISFTSGSGTIRTTTSNSLYFATNSSTAMTIDGAGNVGIGQTSVDGRLHILNGAGTKIRHGLYGSIGNRYSAWDTWIGNNVGVATDSTANVQLLTSYIGDGASALSVGFKTLAYYQWSSTDLTGLSGGSNLTLPTPSLKISPTGLIGIGIDSPSAKLHIVGDTPLKIHSATNGAGAKINFSDHASGSYAQNGTIEYVHSDSQSFGSGNAFKFYGSESSMSFHVAGKGLFTSTVTENYSDIRLKTKVGDIKNALDKIQFLSGFYYEPNETAQSYGYEVKKEIGLSAQEVQQVIPEVVTEAAIGDGYLTIHYQKIVPVLVEAIKELKAEVEALKQQLNG